MNCLYSGQGTLQLRVQEMYEVSSHYTFWGEEDRLYSRQFTSLWDAYDYLISEDDFDTNHKIFRIDNRGKQEVCKRLLDKHRFKGVL